MRCMEMSFRALSREALAGAGEGGALPAGQGTLVSWCVLQL